MVILSLILAVTGGLCMAFQSPTNTSLSQYVGNFQAATISFGGGTLLLAIAAAALGDGSLMMLDQASWWQMIGGFYGAFMVLMVTFGAPVLGIALTLTFSMFGQIVMGTVIDQFGLFQTEPAEVSIIRILGCVAVGIGIVLVYIGKRKQGGSGEAASGKAVLIGILCFLGGVGGAIQSPTNVALSLHIGKIEASFISFTGGFLILLIVTLIVNRGRFQKMKGVGIRPWMVTGGAYGSVVVLFNVIATPYLGVALIVASAMLGQLGGALLIDGFGLLRAPKIKMNSWRYIGVAAIAVGVILVTAARM